MLSTQYSFASGDHAPRADLSVSQRWLLTAGAVFLHGLMAIVVWHASTIPSVPPEPPPLMVSLISNEVVQAEPPKPPEPEAPKPVPPKPVVTPKPQPSVVAATKAPAPQDMVVPAAPEPPAPTPAPPPVATPAPAAPVATAPEPAPPPPKVLPSSAVGYLVEPQRNYPPASQELGETGQVILEILVDPDGRVKDVTITKSSGYPRLDRAAISSIKTARFRPYIHNGVPMSIRVSAPFNYNLDR